MSLSSASTPTTESLVRSCSPGYGGSESPPSLILPGPQTPADPRAKGVLTSDPVAVGGLRTVVGSGYKEVGGPKCLVVVDD